MASHGSMVEPVNAHFTSKCRVKQTDRQIDICLCVRLRSITTLGFLNTCWIRSHSMFKSSNNRLIINKRSCDIVQKLWATALTTDRVIRINLWYLKRSVGRSFGVSVPSKRCRFVMSYCMKSMEHVALVRWPDTLDFVCQFDSNFFHNGIEAKTNYSAR